MDVIDPAAPAALVLAPAAPPLDTVTLAADGVQTDLPHVDAQALISAGLATAAAPSPLAIVLLADVAGQTAGAVVRVSAALLAQLGDKARAATAAEQEIAGPNLKALTSL